MNVEDNIMKKYTKAIEFQLDMLKFKNDNSLISNQTIVIFLVTATYFLLSHLPSKNVDDVYWNMLIIFYLTFSLCSMLLAEIANMTFRREKVRRFHLFSKNKVERQQMLMVRILDIINSILMLILFSVIRNYLFMSVNGSNNITFMYNVILAYIVIKLIESFYSITFGNIFVVEAPNNIFTRIFDFIEWAPKFLVVFVASVIMIISIKEMIVIGLVFKFNDTLIYALYLIAIQYALNHFAVNYSSNIVKRNLEKIYLDIILKKYKGNEIKFIYEEYFINNSVFDFEDLLELEKETILK